MYKSKHHITHSSQFIVHSSQLIDSSQLRAQYDWNRDNAHVTAFQNSSKQIIPSRALLISTQKCQNSGTSRPPSTKVNGIFEQQIISLLASN